MIIILAAIITAIVFYNSGKKKEGKGIKWAITGLFGYVLGFAISIMVIGETFISVFIACGIVYFTHIQLSRMALKSSTTD